MVAFVTGQSRTHVYSKIAAQFCSDKTAESYSFTSFSLNSLLQLEPSANRTRFLLAEQETKEHKKLVKTVTVLVTCLSSTLSSHFPFVLQQSIMYKKKSTRSLSRFAHFRSLHAPLVHYSIFYTPLSVSILSLQQFLLTLDPHSAQTDRLVSCPVSLTRHVK